MIILLIVGLMKRYCDIKLSHFPGLLTNKNKIEFKSDLPNYATKPDLKKCSGRRYITVW